MSFPSTISVILSKVGIGIIFGYGMFSIPIIDDTHKNTQITFIPYQ